MKDGENEVKIEWMEERKDERKTRMRRVYLFIKGSPLAEPTAGSQTSRGLCITYESTTTGRIPENKPLNAPASGLELRLSIIKQ